MFGDLSISGLSRLGYLCIKKDVYYYNEGDLVGEVEGVRVQEGNIFLDLDATGTKDERLLWEVGPPCFNPCVWTGLGQHLD